jgi:hypothetical protein
VSPIPVAVARMSRSGLTELRNYKDRGHYHIFGRAAVTRLAATPVPAMIPTLLGRIHTAQEIRRLVGPCRSSPLPGAGLGRDGPRRISRFEHIGQAGQLDGRPALKLGD